MYFILYVIIYNSVSLWLVVFMLYKKVRFISFIKYGFILYLILFFIVVLHYIYNVIDSLFYAFMIVIIYVFDDTRKSRFLNRSGIEIWKWNQWREIEV